MDIRLIPINKITPIKNKNIKTNIQKQSFCEYIFELADFYRKMKFQMYFCHNYRSY
jgi:hypothetical protein